MSSFLDKFGKNDFSIRKPDGSLNDGTLSSEREDEKGGKSKANTAEIIDASANGLDAITNFLAPFIGGNTPQQQPNYTPAPPPQKKMNPWLIGGVLGGVALIILLIVLNNGKSSNTNTGK